MGFIDIHSHILPNMDDGSHSDEESLEMLRIAYEEGTDLIYATPHNMPGKGRPSPEKVYAAVDRLQGLADDAGIPIQILPGTEYYFREEVMDIFEQDRAIPFGDSPYVLVEFEPMADRNYIRNCLRDIRGTNYTPVLAHIERYLKAMESMEFVAGLQEEKRMIFIRRYWYMDEISVIAKEMGYSVAKVKGMLFRLRKKLKDRLEKDGFF